MALHHVRAGEKVHLLSAAPGKKTAALVKTERFEAAQLVLRAGDSIPHHSVTGYCSIQCLEGSVILETKGRVELKAGDWLYLDRNEEHGVSANENSTLLLTIFFD
jgi:quercetin dioxygenase-like cupin family protein